MITQNRDLANMYSDQNHFVSYFTWGLQMKYIRIFNINRIINIGLGNVSSCMQVDIYIYQFVMIPKDIDGDYF